MPSRILVASDADTLIAKVRFAISMNVMPCDTIVTLSELPAERLAKLMEMGSPDGHDGTPALIRMTLSRGIPVLLLIPHQEAPGFLEVLEAGLTVEMSAPGSSSDLQS